MSKDRLTIEQLRAEQVYVELTSKQKTLVETFIATNGDRTASVLAAYNTKSKENAQIMAHTVLSSPRVMACLAAYFQSDPLEDFKAEVRKAYRNRKITVAQVRAMTLHADLNGWGSDSLPGLHGRDDEPDAKPAAETPTPKHEAAPAPKVWTVGQRVRQRRDDGTIRRGVVTAVDAAGKPTIEDEPRE